jgi:RimJ/RimL family protein N-acetyltransferase
MRLTAPDIPTIHTQRLTLRGHAIEDFDDYVAMWGNPKVTRHIGGRPFSREECWTRFLRNIGHWPLMGFGYWLVLETASGRFIGEIGFADLKRDLDPSIDGLPEMGWVLAPWSHGQGFATESARAAIAWIDRDLAPKRTVCLIDPENVPSLRVADKCGYRELARSTYKGQPVIIFERGPER